RDGDRGGTARRPLGRLGGDRRADRDVHPRRAGSALDGRDTDRRRGPDVGRPRGPLETAAAAGQRGADGAIQQPRRDRDRKRGSGGGGGRERGEAGGGGAGAAKGGGAGGRIAPRVARGVGPERVFGAAAGGAEGAYDATSAVVRFEHAPPCLVVAAVSREADI